MTISLFRGSSKSTFLRLCSRAPLITIRLFGSILIFDFLFVSFGAVFNFYISSCPFWFLLPLSVHLHLPLSGLHRAPGGQFHHAAVQPVQTAAAGPLLSFPLSGAQWFADVQ